MLGKRRNVKEEVRELGCERQSTRETAAEGRGNLTPKNSQANDLHGN